MKLNKIIAVCTAAVLTFGAGVFPKATTPHDSIDNVYAYEYDPTTPRQSIRTPTVLSSIDTATENMWETLSRNTSTLL